METQLKAAWDIGCIIRWLDYNDTWLAAEWGHPSGQLGWHFGRGRFHFLKFDCSNGDATINEREVLESHGLIGTRNSGVSRLETLLIGGFMIRAIAYESGILFRCGDQDDGAATESKIMAPFHKRG